LPSLGKINKSESEYDSILTVLCANTHPLLWRHMTLIERTLNGEKISNRKKFC